MLVTSRSVFFILQISSDQITHTPHQSHFQLHRNTKNKLEETVANLQAKRLALFRNTGTEENYFC